MYTCANMHTHTKHSTCMEAREQLHVVCSLLLPLHDFQVPDLGQYSLIASILVPWAILNILIYKDYMTK